MQVVSRPVRCAHDVLRLGRASRSCPSNEQASACDPHPHLCPRRLRHCTREADAKGDRARVLADVGLRRAGGRPLELPEQPSQAGLDGRGRIGRESRPHICSLVCTRAYGTCTRAETSVARRARVSGSRRIWTSGLRMCRVQAVLVLGCERHACKMFVWSTVASCPQGIFRENTSPFGG